MHTCTGKQARKVMIACLTLARVMLACLLGRCAFEKQPAHLHKQAGT